MNQPELYQVVWVQTLNGAREVVSEPMCHNAAALKAVTMQRQGLAGFGGQFIAELYKPDPPAGDLSPTLGTLT